MSLDFILEHLIPKTLKEYHGWDQALIVFVGFGEITHINNRMMGLKRKHLVDWFHALGYRNTYQSFKQRHFVMPDLIYLNRGWDIFDPFLSIDILEDHNKFVTLIDETVDKLEKLT